MRTRALVLLLLLAVVWPAAAAAQPQVTAVGPIGITVSDMDRAVTFYSSVLTFQKISDVEVAGDEYEHLYGVFGLRVRVVRLRLGDEQIELDEYLAPRGRPIPVDSRSNDRWFQHIAIIVSDMDRAYATLRAHKVEYASSGPQRLPDWNPNAGGIRAFYFKDPDGHPVEILEFPAGKGDPKWHRASGRLFLGIDHTAIVVADTDASLAFYRDLLGMRVAGTSENYGTEQEHLNNVFGAHLRITALRAAAGPGIELLEYLAPRDGRPFPADEHANDLLHRHTILVVADAAAAERLLRGANTPFISSSLTALPTPALETRRAFLARDPDGHALEFIEQAKLESRGSSPLKQSKHPENEAAPAGPRSAASNHNSHPIHRLGAELGTLLTVMLGHSEMLLDVLEKGHPLRSHVCKIKRAGKQAAELVHRLAVIAASAAHEEVS